MQDYLSQLNEAQRRAVEYLDGPQLVIAGAGSGKTRVLTYKIVHLLANGYEPWRILALTFTNKAAREMRERIETLVGSNIASRLWMGTFHSIFSRILHLNAERIGFKKNFTIYDTADSKALIKTIVKDLELDDKVYKVSSIASAISWAKNALISPEAYASDRELREMDRRNGRDRIYEIYRIYRDRCHVSDAMDFDDLLYYTNVLMRDNPDVLRHYREFFRYVLVDEYQDTNFAQHLIVKQLTSEEGNVCVVGDDAQSIYSFRGANVRNILELNRTYPRLREFKLEQNYRSTTNILESANSLIAKNVEQIPKHIFSDNGAGNPVEVVRAYSDFDEAFLVTNRIAERRMQSGDNFNEFAILYRTNAQSRILEEQLRKRNIPYRIYGGLSFYQRKEVKDAVAYFRLAVNPGDDEALKRVINFPARGIGETTLNKLVRAAIDSNVSIWDVLSDLVKYDVRINRGTAAKLARFTALIAGFVAMNEQGEDACTLAAEIFSQTGLMTMYMHDRTPENVSKLENLSELLAGVTEFVELHRQEQGDDAAVGMTQFLSEVSLATDQDKDETAGEQRVTLMTVHAAKGLEFANVFVVGVEEDLFPSAMCTSPGDVEEERRLLYVAITRAKRFCMLSHAGSRFRNGMTVMCRPSRFIGDIDSRYLRFIGDGHYRESPAPKVNPLDNYFRRQPAATFVPARKPASPVAAPTSGGFDRHTISELTEGMTIEHSSFGCGVIKKIENEESKQCIVVAFDNTGTRKLMLRFAKFKIISE